MSAGKNADRLDDEDLEDDGDSPEAPAVNATAEEKRHWKDMKHEEQMELLIKESAKYKAQITKLEKMN